MQRLNVGRLVGVMTVTVVLLGVTTARAAGPAPDKVTPELIEAAKKEGKAIWYTAVDLPVAERIAKAFEAKYPGIAMRVERSGGSVSHTEAPGANLSPGDAVIRSCAPSGASTR